MRLRILACGLLALALSVVAAGDASAAAGPFVKTLADRVLAIFNDRALSFPQREQRLYDITVVDFDVPYSARFALGRYWPQAADGDRQDFTKAFERYIVHVYAIEFDRYHDVGFAVLSERAETPTDSVVRSQIVRHDGRPPVIVDWRVTTAAGAPKIRDVSVEGVSQLLSQRDQFAAVMERGQGGVPALTQMLREKTAQ